MDCSIAYFPLQESEGFVLPEAFLQQLTPEINLLFLCNPNNPTGRTVSPALLQEIWKRCEEPVFSLWWTNASTSSWNIQSRIR